MRLLLRNIIYAAGWNLTGIGSCSVGSVGGGKRSGQNILAASLDINLCQIEFF